jgi:hypothetical protein
LKPETIHGDLIVMQGDKRNLETQIGPARNCKRHDPELKESGYVKGTISMTQGSFYVEPCLPTSFDFK